MAGRFDGLSALEWRLCVAIMPPEPTQRRRGMPQTPCRQVVHTRLDLLITGGRWCETPRGPRWASKRAAQRGLPRWQADGTLAATQARGLGRAEAAARCSGRLAPRDGACSPWERGGEGGARGGIGQGGRIHRLTAGDGRPLAHRTTPAHGDERAQVMPVREAVKRRTGPRGRPRQRLHVIATDTGDEAQALVNSAGRVASGRRSPRASGRPSTTGAARSKTWRPASQPSAPSPGSSTSIAVWSSGGSVGSHVSTRFWPWRPFICGIRD